MAQIVRVGRILSAEGARKGGAGYVGGSEGYRRPLGGGVLPLADLLTAPAHQNEKEYTFKVKVSIHNKCI